MREVESLREIIKSLTKDEDLRSTAESTLDKLESEIEELRFLADKFKTDTIVNENFVRKTVDLLEKSNESLKSSNEKLTKTNNELLISNAELERFAYVASHDLKTPLYNVIRFSSLLKQNIVKSGDESSLEFLSFIIDGGKRMNNLINDILEYSKLSSTENHKIFHLQDSIDEVRTSISEYISAKNASIKVSSDLPSISWDQSKIMILLKNLIENGIKYNNLDSPQITIFSKTNKSFHSVYIQDNGIGIEKEYYLKIFDMFSRLHILSKYEGTGLGLAMCKKIVSEFGGEITLESEIDKGTTFKIDFPKKMIYKKSLSLTE